MNLYLVMAVLYLTAAALVAVDSALTHFELLAWFSALRWLRIHLITLGALTQALFGLLPAVVALRAGRPRPPTRLGIWFSLNAGLLALLVGIPLVNPALILTGGTLVFVAAGLLLGQLRALRPAKAASLPAGAAPGGRRFYLAGLAFFLVGILAGTGLWLGWGDALQMARPKEVHLHANIWGLMSLAFAGLIVDLYPRFAGRPLAWPRTIRPILWLLTGGAALLLAAPWTGINQLTGPGMVLLLAGTAALMLNVIAPLRGDPVAWSRPGIWHLLSAYAWILAPFVAAPLMRSGAVAMPQATIEADAPQWLIYGWLLHLSYALLPFLFRRAFAPGAADALGGSWLSLAAVHLGSAFFWAGIFVEPARGSLQGIAYTLWALSMAPILGQLWPAVRDGLARLEAAEVGPADEGLTGEG